MSTIAHLRLPVDEFALRQTLPRVPDVAVEVNRLVAYETPHVMPFLWAIGDSLDEFERALEEDVTVENVTELTEYEGERFYRMDWTSSIDLLTHTIIHQEGAIVNASGKADAWRLRVLFEDRDALRETETFCQEQGLSLEVEKVYRLTQNSERRYGLFGLTEEQYETLMEALERGYYDVPRGIDARGLADVLSVSHQAVSERLRRGHGNLVSNALVAPNNNASLEEEE